MNNQYDLTPKLPDALTVDIKVSGAQLSGVKEADRVENKVQFDQSINQKQYFINLKKEIKLRNQKPVIEKF